MDRIGLLHFLVDLMEYKRNYQAETSQLKPQDMYLLEQVHFHPGTQTLELARRGGIAPATLISILDRLEAKKLIWRERSAVDRRVVQVGITPVGEGLIRQHLREDERFAANLFELLDREEGEQLAVLLARLAQRADLARLFAGEPGHE